MKRIWLSILSVLSMFLMGATVIYFAYRQLQALDRLTGQAQHDLALHGTIISLVGFHFVWAWATLNQIPMAYAIRKDVGDDYVEMLKTRYKIPLSLLVADIGYFVYFAHRFSEVF